MDEAAEYILGIAGIIIGTVLILALIYLIWHYLVIVLLSVGGLMGVGIAGYHLITALIEAHQKNE